MYQALSHAPNKFEGHQVRTEIYRKSSPPVDGIFNFKSKFSGYVRRKNGSFYLTNEFQIGYTTWGNSGPVVLLLHGVPSNRRAKLHIQELLSPFCRTVAIDMLGMGGVDNDETSMPQLYGQGENASIYDGNPDDSSAWDWVHDCDYIREFMLYMFNEPFIFQADDWGGGILSHYINRFPDDLIGAIWVNPIAFDGYPVSEIQAFGRASNIPRKNIIKNNDGSLTIDDSQFEMLLGSADQTMVQIFKTMVFDINKYNQYVLRDIKGTYVDIDYHRSRSKEGEDANSLTLRLHYDKMRTMAERAAILSPALLLPFHAQRNPKGVDYGKFRGKAQIIWGEFDNMMPAMQIWRFKNVLTGADSVETVLIGNAGHFSELDQPERVAEAMISFASNIVGVQGLGDIFLGYKGIWKGDERIMIEELRQLWKINK